MKYIQHKIRWTKWLCITIFLTSLFINADTFAQKIKRKKPSAGDLLSLFRREYTAKNYDAAIDALYRYVRLRAPSDTPGVIRVTQKNRFRLIQILLKYRPERISEVRELLIDYINLPLGEYPRQARLMLATALFKEKKYAKCVVAAQNALKYDKDPSSRAGAKPLPIKLEKQDPSKFRLRSTEKEFSDATISHLHYLMAEAYFANESWKECIDPYQYVVDHTKHTKRIGHSLMNMIIAMLNLRDFDRLSIFIPQIYKTDARYDIYVNIALMKMAASLYDEKHYNNALPLYRMIMPRKELVAFHKKRLKQMRIDAGLPPEENMKISNAEVTIFGTRKVKKDLEEKATEKLTKAALEAQKKREKERLRDARKGKFINTSSNTKPEKIELTEEEKAHKAALQEIEELSNLIKDLEALPPYELGIKYRMAMIYNKVDRYWEASRFFDTAYKTSPKTIQEKNSFYDWNKYKPEEKEKAVKIGAESIYLEAETLLQKLHQVDQAEKIAFKFMKQNTTGLKPRRMAYLLTRYYQENNMMKKVKKLKPILETFKPDNTDLNILRLDSHLFYMQGVADLVLYEFEKAEAEFKYVQDKFPTSERAETAVYWQGMAMLYQKKFDKALLQFKKSITNYPNSIWKSKAIYQTGVCEFGLGNYLTASNKFNYIIANCSQIDTNFPHSSVFSDACSMRGDLRGATGELVAAEEDYHMAIKSALNEHQAKYAVFKLANIYKKIAVTYKSSDKERALKQYKKIIELVSAYLNKYQNDADIAKAMYWIGKSKIQINSNSAEEVVSDYFNTIVKFGKNVHQEGVDLMIDELVKITRTWLDKNQTKTLLDLLRERTKSTKNNVLKLRLRVLISKMNHTEDVLARNLLSELSDFKDVPPPVLALLCKISLKEKIYDKSEQLLKVFTTHFDESAYIDDAYKLRCYALFAAKKYDETLACLKEVQERFGQRDNMYWAQLKKAETLLAQANQLPWDEAQVKYQAAITNNASVSSIRAWRGIPRAIATFQLGQVEESMGDKAPDQADKRYHWNKAFGYYQRLPSQYKGYAHGYWAAEGYLACANVLKKLGRMNDRRNIYRALLYDRYVNKLPQARIAKSHLGKTEVEEIMAQVNQGFVTNILIKADAEILQKKKEPKMTKDEVKK